MVSRKGKAIYFTDSYGRKRLFGYGSAATSALRKRRFDHVLPEVLELMERVERGPCKSEVFVGDFSLELCVIPDTIHTIFRYLARQGLLMRKAKTDFLNTMDNVFTILRPIKEEDYGKTKAKTA